MPNGASSGRPSSTKVAASPISATTKAPRQALGDAHEVAALPGQQRPERHRDEERGEQRPERRVEERRPDRNLLAGERLERQRIERADEHGGAGGGEEQVVEHQRAFARHRREQSALAQQRRPPREQRERRRR